MIQERISELRVRVRADAGDAAEIGPAAERMARAVLERCAALLEERAPGRLVLIRRLPLRWRVDQSALDDPAQVEDLALAAADAIERIARPPVLDPPEAAEGAVIFDDEAHLRASHLLALARGGPAWFHAALESPTAADPLAALVAPERRATAHATLIRLAQAGVLAEVLAARPAAAVAVFAAALGCDSGDPASGEVELSAFSSASRFPAAGLATVASLWPPLPPAARSLALRVHAAVLLDAAFDAPTVVALSAAVFHAGAHAFDAGPERVPGEEVAPAAGNEAAAGDAPAPEPAKAAGSGEPVAESLDAAAPQPSAATFETTACAGLFYLLDRVQELDLPESLWKACLNEGAVLAAAAAALLGPRFAGDSAPGWFGGTTTVGCPAVNPEQHAEIALATCASLASALPRRGLAEVPPAIVALIDRPAGRLLAAAAVDSPFVFFAWPAATPKMLTGGLSALLEAWPHHGRLSCSPALASLDTSGRLHASRDLGRPNWLLPEASSDCAAALLALVIGAPCLLFAARAGGVSFPSAEAFVTRYLARPARIRLLPEQMEVILRDSDIDLSLRKAALDRDPGWLPWLRRTVRLVFEEQRPGFGGLG